VSVLVETDYLLELISTSPKRHVGSDPLVATTSVRKPDVVEVGTMIVARNAEFEASALAPSTFWYSRFANDVPTHESSATTGRVSPSRGPRLNETPAA
jgi:hypothetical protein